MPSALVSVIIPTYNYADYILDALESLRSQTYENWEAIVVDDGSTDNTQILVSDLAKVDSRISYIYQANKGLPAARNTGIKAAKGTYIQLLDADDLLSPDKILQQVTELEEYGDVGVLYCGTRYFEDSKKETLFTDLSLTNRPESLENLDNKYETIGSFVRKNIMPVNAVLMRKSVIDVVGLQNEFYGSVEDWEYWIRCAFAGIKFKFSSSDAYAMVRVHQTSMSKSKEKMFNWGIQLRSMIRDLIDRSDLPIQEKTQLHRINNRKTKQLYQFLIEEMGFTNRVYLFKTFKKYGLLESLGIYLKALNTRRKSLR